MSMHPLSLKEANAICFWHICCRLLYKHVKQEGAEVLVVPSQSEETYIGNGPARFTSSHIVGHLAMLKGSSCPKDPSPQPVKSQTTIEKTLHPSHEVLCVHGAKLKQDKAK